MDVGNGSCGKISTFFSNLFWTTELTFLGLEKVRHVDCRLQSASDDVSPLLSLREVSTLKVKVIYTIHIP